MHVAVHHKGRTGSAEGNLCRHTFGLPHIFHQGYKVLSQPFSNLLAECTYGPLHNSCFRYDIGAVPCTHFPHRHGTAVKGRPVLRHDFMDSLVDCAHGSKGIMCPVRGCTMTAHPLYMDFKPSGGGVHRARPKDTHGPFLYRAACNIMKHERGIHMRIFKDSCLYHGLSPFKCLLPRLEQDFYRPFNLIFMAFQKLCSA